MQPKRLGLLFFLFFCICTLLYIFFWPRQYNIPSFVPRANTQYLELKTGSKLAYWHIQNQSDTTKTPIIYLHGGPGGIITDEIMNFYRPLVQKGHDLYFYDQIGSGHSDRLEDITKYTVERHLDDLAQLIEKTASEKVTLFGHSWGALLATAYLLEHPEQIDKIILTGPGPILPINYSLAKNVAPDSLNMQAPRFSNKEANAQRYNRRMKLISYCAQAFGWKIASDQEVDDFYSYLNEGLSKATTCEGQKTTRRPGLGYYAHIMTLKSFREVPDRKDQMKNIEVPILLLKGQCDNQAWGFTQEYLEIFPNIQFEILENIGHDITEANQTGFIHKLDKFLHQTPQTTMH
jgi:proline iminopeptidase